MNAGTLTALFLAALATVAPATAQDRGALAERGRAGPDLSRVGYKYREEYLERWLRDPAYLRPSAHMPKLELNERDITALAAYLASLR